jgi:hypothetical protein
MPAQYYMVNIYFPHIKSNPEELRGRVMFYNAPKTVIEICSGVMMRDDAGDVESPEAYGMFFDESAGHLFELNVLKQGRQNSYKTSKFRAIKQPMLKLADGTPDEAGITTLLAQRHDLYSKIEVPDAAKISRVFQTMTNGEDPAEDSNGGFDTDEETKTKPATQTRAAATAATTTTKRQPVVESDDEEVVAAPKKQAKPALTEDPLADEAPIKTPPKTAKPPAEKPAPATKSEPDLNQSAIDDLLGQIDDD